MHMYCVNALGKNLLPNRRLTGPELILYYVIRIKPLT